MSSINSTSDLVKNASKHYLLFEQTNVQYSQTTMYVSMHVSLYVSSKQASLKSAEVHHSGVTGTT